MTWLAMSVVLSARESACHRMLRLPGKRVSCCACAYRALTIAATKYTGTSWYMVIGKEDFFSSLRSSLHWCGLCNGCTRTWEEECSMYRFTEPTIVLNANLIQCMYACQQCSKNFTEPTIVLNANLIQCLYACQQCSKNFPRLC